MAILNTSKQIEGVQLEHDLPSATYSCFSIMPYLDDGVKSSIATLAKSLTRLFYDLHKNFLLYDNTQGQSSK